LDTNSSATARRETPHSVNSTTNQTISDALRRRAQSLIKDKTIDAQSRAILRYGLEINDPWLPELVRRADAGEDLVEVLESSLISKASEDNSGEQKIEALTELICRAGDEPETKSAALLVLMATIENAVHPKALANAAKHFAFTRCGEMNVSGMVDAQVAALKEDLMAGV
jgi:hypothetical protein